MDVKQLQAEIANLKTRLDDALTEVAVHNKRNDYVQAAECGKRIIYLANQLHMRSVHLQDQIKFYGLISDLKNRGISVEAVKKLAYQA
ncbi:hypothetical protein [Solibacillus sp. CAU 1738]|uniref:hypothetical protein n=1 Tax=Solibacillus sp. CAU 1738 TaxID=3140363 RepID=UPI00326069B3